MDPVTMIALGAHAVALLGAVVVVLRFVSGQSARIARTELRLDLHEASIAELKGQQQSTDAAVDKLTTQVAVLESKVDTLLDGQKLILAKLS